MRQNIQPQNIWFKFAIFQWLAMLQLSPVGTTVTTVSATDEDPTNMYITYAIMDSAYSVSNGTNLQSALLFYLFEIKAPSL